MRYSCVRTSPEVDMRFWLGQLRKDKYDVATPLVNQLRRGEMARAELRIVLFQLAERSREKVVTQNG